MEINSEGKISHYSNPLEQKIIAPLKVYSSREITV
jgi:hypothetical protein